MVKLRPYQFEAENQARRAMARGLKRIALYLPTGGGKTLTATWPHGLNEVEATPTQAVLNKIKSNLIAYNKRKEIDRGAF